MQDASVFSHDEGCKTNQSKKCPLHCHSRAKMNSCLEPSVSILKTDLNHKKAHQDVFKLIIYMLIQLYASTNAQDIADNVPSDGSLVSRPRT